MSAFCCRVVLQALGQVVNEGREDPFQDITLSYQEEANDEVNVTIMMNMEMTIDVDVEVEWATTSHFGFL